jgi:hypothetical protein
MKNGTSTELLVQLGTLNSNNSGATPRRNGACPPADTPFLLPRIYFLTATARAGAVLLWMPYLSRARPNNSGCRYFPV